MMGTHEPLNRAIPTGDRVLPDVPNVAPMNIAPNIPLPGNAAIGGQEPPTMARSNRKRAKPQTAVQNFQLTNQIHPRERVRVDQQARRNEARLLRNRLKMQTPSGPFGPTERFSGEAIRLEEWGERYLGLDDQTDSRTARATLMTEIYRERKRIKDNSYMH